MKKYSVEFYVGLFVILGSACTVYLMTQLGGIDLSGRKSLCVHAYFTSVSGLTTGASVEMAGVKIGRVTGITLDAETMMADVELCVDEEIELSEDIMVSVKTAGIIGDKYINILPGGSENFLGRGDKVFNTESAVDIEALVSKYIFDKGE